MPYPLDPETAAAVEAGKRHHVLTWEVFEEGDDLGQWVRESFVAEGKTPLPYGTYLMKSATKTVYVKVPAKEEVRELFEDEDSFQRFLDGGDYSNGLADVTDSEFDGHYEAVLLAVKNLN